MKKLELLILSIIWILFIASAASAARMSLGLSAGSLNFGAVDMWQTSASQPAGGLTISAAKESAETDVPRRWRIQIIADHPLRKVGGSEEISRFNFRYWTWKIDSEAKGTLMPLQYYDKQNNRKYNILTYSSDPLPNPKILYVCANSEMKNSNTRIHLQADVKVPFVSAGTYTNTISIIMTE